MSQPRPTNLAEVQRYMGVVQFLCVHHVHYNVLELISFNLTGVLVRRWLNCIQYLSCLVDFCLHVWSRCGGLTKERHFISGHYRDAN